MKTDHIYIILFAAVCCLALSCNELNTVKPIVDPEKPDFHIIPQEDAIANLYSFMDEVEMNTRSGEGRVIKTVDSYPVQTKGTDDVEAYIINFENNSGYAVLGARSDMTEIIAVTEKGNIDPVTLSIIDPPSVGDSLGGRIPIGEIIPLDPIDDNGTEIEIDDLTLESVYSSSEDDYAIGGDFTVFISQTISSGIRYRQLNSMPSETLVDYNNYNEEHTGSSPNTDPILPKLSTNWGQGQPYNDYCKLYNGYRRLVGCSPLAAGMIMAYNNYPDVLRVNDTQIEWQMIDNISSIDSTSSDPQRTHIPLLLASIFWKCDRFAYRDDWTLITANQIKERFKKMKYTNVSMLCGREFTSEMLAETISMLRADKPVFVSALGYEVTDDDEKNTEGHSWVIDGALSDRSMLHCNWGWYGGSNGYFSADCFKTTTSTGISTYERHFRLIRYDMSGNPEASVDF